MACSSLRKPVCRKPAPLVSSAWLHVGWAVKGYGVDAKGYMRIALLAGVDAKGYRGDAKGYSVDAKGYMGDGMLRDMVLMLRAT
eukprot:7168221-Pyramimonas_sp.AAC.1